MYRNIYNKFSIVCINKCYKRNVLCDVNDLITIFITLECFRFMLIPVI